MAHRDDIDLGDVDEIAAEIEMLAVADAEERRLQAFLAAERWLLDSFGEPRP